MTYIQTLLQEGTSLDIHFIVDILAVIFAPLISFLVVRAQINGQKDLIKAQTTNLRQQSEYLQAQEDEIYQRIAFQEAQKRAENRAELEKKIEELKKQVEESEAARLKDRREFEKERKTWAAEKQDLLEQWRKKEQGYAEAINGLTSRIRDLEGKQKKVERIVTDELKKAGTDGPG